MKITKDTKKALEIVNEWKAQGHKVYMTSGGFDPMHIGHLRCIQGTSTLALEDNGKVITDGYRNTFPITDCLDDLTSQP